MKIGIVLGLSFGILYHAYAQGKRPHQDSRALAQQDSIERLQAFSSAPYFTSKKSYAYPVMNQQADIRIDSLTSDSVISNFLEWKDYAGHDYSGYWEVRFKDFRASSNYRTNFNEARTNKHILNEEYRYYLDLAQFDTRHLDYAYMLFDNLKNIHQLNRRDFAQVIVSCVQSISYTLILNQGTNDTLLYDTFTKDYLKENKPVLYNMRHGILSPVEFVATLQGDCDTRCVLLYTLLKHYGYDVAIMVSDKHNHAILGILENYPGVYKVHLGKRYVVWETTQKDAKPGELNSDYLNMNDWEVVVR